MRGRVAPSEAGHLLHSKNLPVPPVVSNPVRVADGDRTGNSKAVCGLPEMVNPALRPERGPGRGNSVK